MFPLKKLHFGLKWENLSSNNRDQWSSSLTIGREHFAEKAAVKCCICGSDRGYGDAGKNFCKNFSMSRFLFHCLLADLGSR